MAVMTVGREQRMAAIRPRIEAEFGPHLVATIIEILTLTELAWHDAYGEPSPPEQVVEDIIVVSGGDLRRFIAAALLAVTDPRDLRLSAVAKQLPPS
jgi:hypothetical protein